MEDEEAPDAVEVTQPQPDWMLDLDYSHFVLSVPDDTRYSARPETSLEDQQANRVEYKIIEERDRIECQMGPRTLTEQRIVDAAELILVRQYNIRCAQNRERRFETPDKYYAPAENPELNRMQRPIWKGLYDARLRPVKYYFGHKPGDFIFRYYHLPCVPFHDPRRWVYEGQVPYPMHEYDARLRQKIFPDVLSTLVRLLSFDDEDPTFAAPIWLLEVRYGGRVALAEPKVQSRIVRTWTDTVKGARLEAYLAMLHNSHLVQELAWLFKRGKATIPLELFEMMILIMPNLETMQSLADKHDDALEQMARRKLFDEGEGWRIVNPAEESRISRMKATRHPPHDWEDYNEEDEAEEREIDCSQVLVYTLNCDESKECKWDGSAAVEPVHESEVEDPYVYLGTPEKPLRDSESPGLEPGPCDRHFLLQPQHTTPPRFSRCAIHEHHNKLRLDYGPNYGYYPDERYTDSPTVPERVDIAGLAVEITRSTALRIQDELNVGVETSSGSSSDSDTSLSEN
ncbi:hypothetical protein ACHAQA_007062 [Verticillium albo-atrum]